MYTPLYNRLCGWLLVALACVGFAFGHLGDYFTMNTTESTILLALGLIAIVGARSRYRYAIPIALLVGLLLAVWGLWSTFAPLPFVGTTEPLENVIRIVAGGWGAYVAIQDFLTWRAPKSS